jgi:hypothetical protein
MEQRKVIMSMDRKHEDYMDVESRVPQWSLVSPVIFNIYLARLFRQVETDKEDSGSEGISLVNEVEWFIQGEDVGECTQ